MLVNVVCVFMRLQSIAENASLLRRPSIDFPSVSSMGQLLGPRLDAMETGGGLDVSVVAKGQQRSLSPLDHDVRSLGKPGAIEHGRTGADSSLMACDFVLAC